MSNPVEVLEYWLEEVGTEGWYVGGAALDAEIRDRFGDLWQAARAGGLEHWIDRPAPTLAYIIVTDQFPRNMWRDTAEAFATDLMALTAARIAIDSGWDMQVPEPERQFFFLPFMHSEALADQEYCVALMAERMPETGAGSLPHARAHAEIIRRFGRFPYRNQALGRSTTEAEEAFLEGGGYVAILRQFEQG